jgi:uncharacterized membrane protein
MDSIKKTLAKTFSWRITATITTILIAWAITGDYKVGLAIGGVEFIAKMFIYFIHERVWNKI